MLDKIAEKAAELKRIMPDDPQLKDWLRQSDLWCWLYSYFRISGQVVSRSSVASMVSGELKEDIALSLYAFAGRYRDVYYDMSSCLAMDADLDAKTLSRWAGMLTDPQEPRREGSLYRLNSPIIYEWEHIPPHFKDLPKYTEELLKNSRELLRVKDPIELAARMHMELNRLYPYGEDTVLMSMTALLYCILRLGLPAPELSIGDIEYNKMAVKYFEDRDIEPFADMLKRSIFNRLDQVLGIIKQAAENAVQNEQEQR